MNIENFIKWLTQNGAEILPVCSAFEDVRFKGKEVGIIYKSGKTSGPYAADAVKCFKYGKSWNGKPVNVGRQSTYKKEKVKLLERDGCNCFLCGQPLEEDITVEHLISLAGGGKNELSNMVLTHEKCNHELGNLPISEKVKMAIKYRIKELINQ